MSNTYLVNELFYSLQGEGANAGTAAVFCRFSGCNLWSGREQDRATATCSMCDTAFRGTAGDGGGRYPGAVPLAEALYELWLSRTVGPPEVVRPFVVLTGGEPLLQVDAVLVEQLHQRGFRIALETNGTLPAPLGIDWICVSPKAHTTLALDTGNELKLVFPQDDLDPEDYAGLVFDYFFLQPRDGPEAALATQQTLRYCLDHPRWRLSLQLHKVLNIP